MPLASERSLGKTVTFLGKEIPVEVLNKDSFDGVEIALFSAGGGISKEFGPIAARAGAWWWTTPAPGAWTRRSPWWSRRSTPSDIGLYTKTGIIANPNCSTIQMVVALKPLHDAAGIKRIVVSTYQAVSGTGQKAMEELEEQVRALLSGQATKTPRSIPTRSPSTACPTSTSSWTNGYTKEEMKMVNETQQDHGGRQHPVTATTVRVPVFYGHSEAVNIETERKLTAEEVRELLAAGARA